jgi:hypothetical protein
MYDVLVEEVRSLIRYTVLYLYTVDTCWQPYRLYIYVMNLQYRSLISNEAKLYNDIFEIHLQLTKT